MWLRLLGQLNLTDEDGRAVDVILSRPKALALLIYLSVTLPKGFQRRDKLVSLFWPDYDSERARHALRQTCYVLRRSLPGVLGRRGSEELRVVASRLWCDVCAMEEAFLNGHFETICDLYNGDFADGLHAPGAAPEFDHWLSAERKRLRWMALEAAWSLTDDAKRDGDAEAAARWADWALQVSPFDELSLRRQVEVLDHFGDRSGAILAYDRFAKRIRTELDVEPSPETQSLIEDVKHRTEPALPDLGPRRSWRTAVQHTMLLG